MRKQDYFPSFFAKKIIHRMILTINLKFFPKKNINLKVYYIKNKSTAAVAYLKKKKKTAVVDMATERGRILAYPPPPPNLPGIENSHPNLSGAGFPAPPATVVKNKYIFFSRQQKNLITKTSKIITT